MPVPFTTTEREKMSFRIAAPTKQTAKVNKNVLAATTVQTIFTFRFIHNSYIVI